MYRSVYKLSKQKKWAIQISLYCPFVQHIFSLTYAMIGFKASASFSFSASASARSLPSVV